MMGNERFDQSKVNISDCHGLRSMLAITRSGQACNKMYDLLEEGYRFFFDGEIIVPKFKFGYGEDLSIALVSDNHAHILFVGDVTALAVHSKDKYLPYTTLKDQREFWLRFNYVRPEELKMFEPF